SPSIRPRETASPNEALRAGRHGVTAPAWSPTPRACRLLEQVEDQEDDQDEQHDSAGSVEHRSLTSSARFASSRKTTAKRRGRLRRRAARRSAKNSNHNERWSLLKQTRQQPSARKAS